MNKHLFNRNSIFLGTSFIFLIIGCYFQFNGLSHRLNDINLINAKLSTYKDSISIFLFTFVLLSILNKTKILCFFSIFLFSLLFFIYINKFFIFFWTIAIIYSCYSIGKILSSFFYLNKNLGLHNSFVGYFLIVLLCYVTSFFPINNVYTFSLIVFIPIIINLYIYKINIFKSLLDEKKLFNKIDLSFLQILLIAILSIYFMVSLMPEIGHDALAMHMYIPSYVNNFAKWDYDFHTYIWAILPLSADLFFSFLYILGGPDLTKFSLFVFLVFVIYLLKDILTDLQFSTKYKYFVLLLTISTPVFYLITSSLFVELPWLISLLLVLSVGIKSHMKIKINFIFYLFSFLFLALTTKHISIIYLSILFSMLLICDRKYLNLLLKQICSNYISYFFIFLILFPFLFAYYSTGNPFFPFFNNIFKSEFFDTNGFNNLLFNYKDFKLFLYDFTFHSDYFLEGTYGSAGFFWLFFTIPTTLFYIFFPAKKIFSYLFIFCITSWFFIFYFQSYMRYIIFLYPILYILFSYFVMYLNALNFNKFYLLILHGLLYLCIFLNLAHLNSSTNYGLIDFKVIKSNFYRDNYLERFLPIQHSIKFINKLDSNHNKKLLIIGAPQGANFGGKVYYLNWYNPKLLEEFMYSIENDNLTLFYEKHHFDYIIYDRNFLNNNFLYNGNNLTKSEVNKRIISGLASSNLIHSGIYQLQ